MTKFRAYLELLRISNVLTAVADVWMGMIVTAGTLGPASVSVPLTLASVLLYLSGMVLNDVFDAERDASERPSRPIPSGRIKRREGALLGGAMMISGVGLAGLVSYQQQTYFPIYVAATLAGLILLYDSALKQTVVGPFLMGLCRGANAFLGLSAFAVVSPLKGLPHPPSASGTIVVGLSVYIIGLTFFARREASVNSRWPLAFSAVLSLAGIALLAHGPLRYQIWPPVVPYFRWVVLWLVIALLIARRYVAAILQPTPKHIQAAVGNAIQSIILIDAALAWGYAGPFWGLAILALLPPTILMARFIPQT